MKIKQATQLLVSFSIRPLAIALILAPAFSANAHTLIDLGPNLVPKAINNSGVVVGSSNTDQYPTTAFSWSSGDGFSVISGGMSAEAVNDNRLIVGSTIDGAFIGNRDWSNYAAFGMNQLDEVAGYNIGENPAHEFISPGKYLVTLVVTDDQGLTSSTQVEITVRKRKGK